MGDKKETLRLARKFTAADVTPYSMVEWETRTAQITDSKGNVIFEQKDIKVPKTWSQTALNIVASKYLHGKLGTSERETGIDQLIERVVTKITNDGIRQGYFDAANAEVFRDELAFILLTQRAAFNSPVWFNVGCENLEPNAEASNWHWDYSGNRSVYRSVGYTRPQCSACFINAVEDSMEGIMRLATTEAMLFKFGSGTGTNFSSLRSSAEHVSGGGVASGPLSFMKGLDAFAGVIKSGGKTRRAAKMAILNAEHPDILDFINCKMKEEAKAQALMTLGYDGSGPDSEAYSSIFYQNANNSIRVTDEFMKAVEEGKDYPLIAVKDGRTIGMMSAQKVLTAIADATWHCGDPGMQYDTTINKWHTSKNTARINASNPCSEYMFLDDSACNLASINLMKFVRKNGFDVEAYQHTVDILIVAQDILVDMSGYPTEQISKNSHDYRPLGLGYANLGALLMSMGLAYDSDLGRAWAAALTSIMTGEAYYMSAVMAGVLKPLVPANKNLKTGDTGACPGWFRNQDSFLGVIRMHKDAAARIPGKDVPTDVMIAALEVWNRGEQVGQINGYRNSQVTVLAPTGTIGFMMDCDTTGVEPELALVKYKKLVGGGHLKLVNETVTKALSKLGYKDPLLSEIIDYISENGTIEGSALAASHLPVFDCSFKPAKGKRAIHHMGHLKMMAAVQPFLSGAISKTINMPEDSTVEDIEDAYLMAWKLGLKSVAIYRDGSKRNQVLTTRKEEKKIEKVAEQNLLAPPRVIRHSLPDERPAITHKFAIQNHEGYLTVGLYENGMPGEMFITMSKEGSTISGLMDSFALAISMALQHGVPLELLCKKFQHTRFEPSGWSKNPDIGYAKSIMDYIFRWLELRFIHPLKPKPDPNLPAIEFHKDVEEVLQNEIADAPSCSSCGSIMVRNGSCHKCIECGDTSGCS